MKQYTANIKKVSTRPIWKLPSIHQMFFQAVYLVRDLIGGKRCKREVVVKDVNER